MTTITISRDPKNPFSAFAVAYEVIRQAKGIVSKGKINIQLEGFDRSQNTAIQMLLLVAQDSTAHKHIADPFEPLEADSTSGPVQAIGTPATADYDKDANIWEFSFPTNTEGHLPIKQMKYMLREISRDISLPDRNDQLTRHGKEIYKPLYFPDMAQLEIIAPILAHLARAHGHDASTIGTTRPDRKLPRILVPVMIYDDILRKENLISPPYRQR